MILSMLGCYFGVIGKSICLSLDILITIIFVITVWRVLK